MKREKKKHVGRAKAGWAVGYRRLGGRVPAWIGRHIGGKGRGRLVDRTRGQAGKKDPMLILANSVEEIADISIRARVVPRARKSRQAKLKKRVEFLMRRRWR